jgi:general secretion pathway protein E
MGVEPFLLASSLEVVMAQRLVRRICQYCKESYKPTKTLLKSLNNSVEIDSDVELYRGKGCNECMNSGMRGRTAIFELLRMTNQLRELIVSKPTTEQIVKAAPADHVCLRHNGIEKMLAGVTTAEEVLRATQGIDDE